MVGLYLFLEVATAHKPSTTKAIAGVIIPPVVPLNKIHRAYAIQRIPTISLSFLTLSIHPPETQADI